MDASFNTVWSNIHNQLTLAHHIKIEQAKLKFKLEKELPKQEKFNRTDLKNMNTYITMRK